MGDSAALVSVADGCKGPVPWAPAVCGSGDDSDSEGSSCVTDVGAYTVSITGII